MLPGFLRPTRKRTAENEFSRRALLRRGSLLAVLPWLPNSSGRAGGAAAVKSDAGIYEAIGVRPLINCKGTYTIISGSLPLPEVRAAMDEASRHFVQLDELMEAVGGRLAELTDAEWGIVTAGCSAAETLAACACVAGANPERIQRLPDLKGMKDEVVIPRYSRNVYDHAVRMVGVRLMTVDSLQELAAALGPRTAMVYILACPEDTGPLGLEPVARFAREQAVPVFVDAAAEDLTPEIHFSRGADLVGYSGGKALRGPQCAGLLLGRKDLCRAAWINSAPHHAFGRSMKVGKEEIMGMLAAVEAWYRRDHAAEWRQWESWLDRIAAEVRRVDGVHTEVIPPAGLSNRAPQLKIRWDGRQLGISGQGVYDYLLQANPRIQLARADGTVRQDFESSAVFVMPWMMQPGEAETVAGRLHSVLSAPPRRETAHSPPEASPAEVAGAWDVELQFTLGRDRHQLFLEQAEDRLAGMHLGDALSGPLEGWIEGNRIEMRSRQDYEGARLHFNFRGMVSGKTMEGVVDMGEYGEARWNAIR